MERIDNNRIIIRKEHIKANNDIVIYVDKQLEKHIEDESINQLMDIAKLPYIEEKIVAMPDIHTGYGFPIGAITAFDYKNGIISPGGVGYDINCGIRILKTPFEKADIINKIETVLIEIFNKIPGGVGVKSNMNFTKQEFNGILRMGMKALLNMGFASEEDLRCTESDGYLETDIKVLSQKAFDRGFYQQCTLGSGNHFIEIQFVEKIYDYEIAKKWGIFDNQICFMIHTGSRGFGHQICSDALKEIQKQKHDFPNKQLAYTLFHSSLGQQYFNAMNCAANYAWANRQFIMHGIREVLYNLGFDKDKFNFKLLYDVSHNIAKIEYINNKKLIIHRKGATRAFAKGNKELSKNFIDTGQPVIIPGSMGSNSYILRGTEKAYNETLSSAAHGAGRLLSRKKALKVSKHRNIKHELYSQGIKVLSASKRTINEELPEAYKDIDNVVEVMHNSGISLRVARLRPLGVIKG